MRIAFLLSLFSFLISCEAPGGGSPYFEPFAFYVEGWFGYDGEAREAVAYTVEGEVYDPSLSIEFVDERYFEEGEASWRCTATLAHDVAAGGPLPLATWPREATARGDAPVWFGFRFPESSAVESGCTGWNPAFWAEEPEAVVARWSWGLGISALDDAVATQLEETVVAQSGQAAWESDWEGEVFGGGFWWNGAEARVPGGFLNHDYAFGAVVDEAFAVVLDQEGAATAIAASEVDDGSPPSGAYALLAWYGVDAGLIAASEAR